MEHVGGGERLGILLEEGEGGREVWRYVRHVGGGERLGVLQEEGGGGGRYGQRLGTLPQEGYILHTFRKPSLAGVWRREMKGDLPVVLTSDPPLPSTATCCCSLVKAGSPET